MLEVSLLGQFKIRRDDRLIEIGSRPAESLFAYLILQRGAQHRRERLAGLLWPESAEESARNNLRQALWRVRRSIETDPQTDAPYLLTDKSHIGWNEQAQFWLDVQVLERDLPWEAATQKWIEVVSAYGGELLPGFYEDWVQLERERLRVTFEQKLTALLERLGGEGHWSELLTWGERGIALGDGPEPAFRAVMRAHFEQGDSASAAAAYQRCVKALQSWDVEPSAETEQLYQAILQRQRMSQQALRPGRAEVTDMPAFLSEQPEPKRPPFVVRERALARLDEWLQAAFAGQGRVGFLSGDIGSGKTALLNEFARRGHGKHGDLLIARGECNSLTGLGDPYLPFREAFGCLVGDLESIASNQILSASEARRAWEALPESTVALLERGPDLIDSLVSVAWLARVAPRHGRFPQGVLDQLQSQTRRTAFGGPGPDQRQTGLFNQSTEFLTEIARRRPLLVTLDDLQWADLGSLDLLFHLARRLEHSRILIVGTFRSEEIEREAAHPLMKILAECKRAFGEVEIDLSAEPVEEGRAFVDAFLDTESNQLGETFREPLFRQTAGHPLFTIELLRTMQSSGAVVQDAERGWSVGAALDWNRLPAKVEVVIAERVAGLDRRLQEILSVASVEGTYFSAEAIAKVLGLEERVLIRALSQELDKRQRIVLAHGARQLNGRRLSLYRFRHNLFQTYLYSRLDSVERGYLHAEVGSTLEQLYGAHVDEIAVQLALHFAQAGDSQKAIRYLHMAGERARRLSANAEAVSHLRRGLELLPGLPEGAGRANQELSLQISLGAATIGTKGFAAPEVEEAFGRARELSHELGATPQLFPAIWGLWTFHTTRGSHLAARELALQLRQIANQARDPGLRLEASRALGTTLFYLGEIRKARQLLELGIELYDPERDAAHAVLYIQDPLVSCMINVGLCLWLQGSPDQALDRMQQAISTAEKIRHPHSLAYALLMAATLHSSRREWDQSLERANQSIALSRKHGFPLWLTAATILRGAALALMGRAEGSNVINEGLAAWQAHGAGLGLPHYLSLLAMTRGAEGQTNEALQHIDAALRIAVDNHELVHEPELFRLKGELLRQQDPAAAERYFERAIQASKEMRARTMELRAVLSLYRLRSEQGRWQPHKEWVRRIYREFREGFETPDLIEARSILFGSGPIPSPPAA